MSTRAGQMMRARTPRCVCSRLYRLSLGCHDRFDVIKNLDVLLTIMVRNGKPAKSLGLRVFPRFVSIKISLERKMTSDTFWNDEKN